ncbi:hypothetical protein RND81_07G095800 [Saponaria officinalis]|uniref:Uncharacterized protein n=1 Tax=Saponaria officinalis TaxID=3572 RepID=A0AAW1JQR7_SAPOF
MGSNYFGVPSMGNERSSSSTSSSRKGKKSGGGSDKPKQPQRGLGVAQLEQIRLRTQMACGLNPPLLQEDIMRVQGVPQYGIVPQSSTSYPNNYSQSSPSTSSTYGHHPNFMLAFGEENNVRCQDSQPTTTLRWNPNSTGVLDQSTFRQSALPSRQLPYFEDPRQGRSNLMRSSSQNSESSDHGDVDLELRLSI